MLKSTKKTITEIAEAYEKKLEEFDKKYKAQKYKSNELIYTYESLMKEYDYTLSIVTGKNLVDEEGNMNRVEEMRKKILLDMKIRNSTHPFKK